MLNRLSQGVPFELAPQVVSPTPSGHPTKLPAALFQTLLWRMIGKDSTAEIPAPEVLAIMLFMISGEPWQTIPF